jgi:pyrimidine operon attenuation protein/uracil phosphoribosyltransferase
MLRLCITDGLKTVLASEGIDDRLVAQEIGLPAIDEYLSFHRRLGTKLVPLLDLGELGLPIWSDGLGSPQAASNVGVSSYSR